MLLIFHKISPLYGALDNDKETNLIAVVSLGPKENFSGPITFNALEPWWRCVKYLDEHATAVRWAGIASGLQGAIRAFEATQHGITQGLIDLAKNLEALSGRNFTDKDWGIDSNVIAEAYKKLETEWRPFRDEPTSKSTAVELNYTERKNGCGQCETCKSGQGQCKICRAHFKTGCNKKDCAFKHPPALLMKAKKCDVDGCTGSYCWGKH